MCQKCYISVLLKTDLANPVKWGVKLAKRCATTFARKGIETELRLREVYPPKLVAQLHLPERVLKRYEGFPVQRATLYVAQLHLPERVLKPSVAGELGSDVVVAQLHLPEGY